MKRSLSLLVYLIVFLASCSISDPEMMEALQKIKAQNEMLLQEVVKMKSQLDALDGKYQVILASLADSKKELEALKAQIDDLKAQISQQLIKIDQLSAQLTVQGADIEKLSVEIAELKASCAELKAKMEELLAGKSPIPTNGLIAWYPFSGNANDESGNANNGQITNASLTADRNNLQNNAYKFDHVGASWGQLSKEIYIPYNSIFNQGKISVSVWVNPKSYFWTGNPSDPNSVVIHRFENGYSNPNGQTWGIRYNENSFTAFLLAASSTNNQQNSTLSSSTPLELGKWANILFTFDGTKFKLYYNGVLIKETTTTITLNSLGNSGISIGVSRQANGFWNQANADIDDVAIWNRALTEAEVSKIYRGEKF